MEGRPYLSKNDSLPSRQYYEIEGFIKITTNFCPKSTRESKEYGYKYKPRLWNVSAYINISVKRNWYKRRTHLYGYSNAAIFAASILYEVEVEVFFLYANDLFLLTLINGRVEKEGLRFFADMYSHLGLGRSGKRKEVVSLFPIWTEVTWDWETSSAVIETVNSNLVPLFRLLPLTVTGSQIGFQISKCVFPLSPFS